MPVFDIFRRVFLEAGLPQHVADGIAANLVWESGGGTDINSSGVGDNGASHGAGQWQGTRWSGPNGLQAFAASRGTNWTDPETQARFILHELQTGAGGTAGVLDRLRNATSAEQATEIFMSGYEKPGTPHMQGRLRALSAITGTPVMAYAGGGGTSGGPAGAVNTMGAGGTLGPAPTGPRPLPARLFGPEARAARGTGERPLLSRIAENIGGRREGRLPILENIKARRNARGIETPIIDMMLARRQGLLGQQNVGGGPLGPPGGPMVPVHGPQGGMTREQRVASLRDKFQRPEGVQLQGRLATLLNNPTVAGFPGIDILREALGMPTTPTAPTAAVSSPMMPPMPGVGVAGVPQPPAMPWQTGDTSMYGQPWLRPNAATIPVERQPLAAPPAPQLPILPPAPGAPIAGGASMAYGGTSPELQLPPIPAPPFPPASTEGAVNPGAFYPWGPTPIGNTFNPLTRGFGRNLVGSGLTGSGPRDRFGLPSRVPYNLDWLQQEAPGMPRFPRLLSALLGR